MDKDLFLQWLLKKRRLAPKAAQDAVSRCKRIESTLDNTLERATSSQVAFDAALTELWRNLPDRHDLMYAMRLYATFKNPKLDTKPYAFYGKLNRMHQGR